MTELETLRALVRELAEALNCWADAKESPELDDLLDRARKAVAP